MSMYSKGLSKEESTKILQENKLYPNWRGSLDEGNLSGHTVIVSTDDYSAQTTKHVVRFETQAAYVAFLGVLEAAVWSGYREARERLDRAL